MQNRDAKQTRIKTGWRCVITCNVDSLYSIEMYNLLLQPCFPFQLRFSKNKWELYYKENDTIICTRILNIFFNEISIDIHSNVANHLQYTYIVV